MFAVCSGGPAPVTGESSDARCCRAGLAAALPSNTVANTGSGQSLVAHLRDSAPVEPTQEPRAATGGRTQSDPARLAVAGFVMDRPRAGGVNQPGRADAKL